MLDLKGKEAKTGSVTIDNITKDTLDQVLNFLYTEELPEITLDQALDVATAADYLQLAYLKKVAVDKWKELFIATEDCDAVETIEAFRTFVNSPLCTDISKGWRQIMELAVCRMFDEDAQFDIEKESNTLIAAIVDYFGASLPYLAVDLLCQWAAAEKSMLTKKERNERKKFAAELVTQIHLTSLRMRTLALISKRDIFPANYMLQMIQQKLESVDEQITGAISYQIKLIKNRLIELEHETGYVLFRFTGDEQEEDENEEDEFYIWEILHAPEHCSTRVAVKHPTAAQPDIIWDADLWAGTLDEEHEYDNYIVEDKVCLAISLKRKSAADSEDEEGSDYEFDPGDYTYNLDYD
jgi:hypothetical protein